jgi:hypothetical protein
MRAVLLSLVLASLPGLALAQVPSTATTQPLTYDIKTLSFDRWCQEDQHYAPARCDAREPGDVAAFEDYRARVERYDLKYQKERTRENAFEKDVLKRDPSAPPTQPDVIAPSPQ